MSSQNEYHLLNHQIDDTFSKIFSHVYMAKSYCTGVNVLESMGTWVIQRPLSNYSVEVFARWGKDANLKICDVRMWKSRHIAEGVYVDYVKLPSSRPATPHHRPETIDEVIDVISQGILIDELG